MTVRMASPTATQEEIEEVLTKHGNEVVKETPAEDAAAAEEPKRDDFETDEEHEAALVEWQQKQEEAAEAAAGKTNEDEEEEEDKPAQPARKPSRFAKRFRKLTAPLEARIAELQDQLKDVQKSGKAAEEKPEEKDPRPVKANFKTQEEYEDALMAWGARKAIADKEATDAQKAQQAFLQENYDNCRAGVEAFKEEHDDWDETINQNIPMHQGVQLAILEQENGAEVVYYLGKHPAYATKLAEMSPLSAVMEVGRLSERLLKQNPAGSNRTAGGGTPLKPKPRLPAPVKPVTTSATTSTVTTKSAKSLDEFRQAKAAGRTK